MDRINVSKPFVLYAQCSVDYDGRASSHLDEGNYLIVRKTDGSLMIHGNTLCVPINYQGSKATLTKDGKKLISTRKKETITVHVSNIWWYEEVVDWSEGKISISKTEFQLRDKIAFNISALLNAKIVSCQTEAPTSVGTMDILAIDDKGQCHIVEVKRGKANLAAVSQLKRYVDYYQLQSCVGWLASPDISKNALKHLNDNGLKWLQVSH